MLARSIYCFSGKQFFSFVESRVNSAYSVHCFDKWALFREELLLCHHEGCNVFCESILFNSLSKEQKFAFIALMRLLQASWCIFDLLHHEVEGVDLFKSYYGAFPIVKGSFSECQVYFASDILGQEVTMEAIGHPSQYFAVDVQDVLSSALFEVIRNDSDINEFVSTKSVLEREIKFSDLKSGKLSKENPFGLLLSRLSRFGARGCLHLKHNSLSLDVTICGNCVCTEQKNMFMGLFAWQQGEYQFEDLPLPGGCGHGMQVSEVISKGVSLHVDSNVIMGFLGDRMYRYPILLKGGSYVYPWSSLCTGSVMLQEILSQSGHSFQQVAHEMYILWLEDELYFSDVVFDGELKLSYYGRELRERNCFCSTESLKSIQGKARELGKSYSNGQSSEGSQSKESDGVRSSSHSGTSDSSVKGSSHSKFKQFHRFEPKSHSKLSTDAAVVLEELQGVLASLKGDGFYEILNVSPGCGSVILSQGFSRVIFKYHPDRYVRFQDSEILSVSTNIMSVLNERFNYYKLLEENSGGSVCSSHVSSDNYSKVELSSDSKSSCVSDGFKQDLDKLACDETVLDVGREVVVGSKRENLLYDFEQIGDMSSFMVIMKDNLSRGDELRAQRLVQYGLKKFPNEKFIKCLECYVDYLLNTSLRDSCIELIKNVILELEGSKYISLAFYYLGQLYMDAGRLLDADKSFRQSLKLDSNNFDSQRGLRLVEQRLNAKNKPKESLSGFFSSLKGRLGLKP